MLTLLPFPARSTPRANNKRSRDWGRRSCRWWRSALILLAVSPCFVPGAEVPSADDLAEVPLAQLLSFKVQSVYAASKYEQRIAEAPSSVTIIEADEIKFLGRRNFAEVLQGVRGLSVTYDRNYSYLGLRGFNRPGDYTSRVLVLINGHRVNENVLDSILLGYDFLLDVDLIQRIEVIRGPSSSIYGNSAFFGVINVVTKTGADLNGMQFSGVYGSFDTYKGSVSYGKRFENGVQLLWSGSYLTSDGQDRLFYPEYADPSVPGQDGYTYGTDYEHYYKTFLTLSYGDFTFEAGFNSREKGIPTGSFNTLFNDPSARTVDMRGYADLKYQRTLGDDWNVLARLYYDNYYYYGDYPILEPTVGRVLYTDFALGHWWGTDMQLGKKIHDKHSVVFGTDFRHNLRQDQGNDTESVADSTYEDQRESWSVGLYTQAEARLHEKLSLNAGIRYDHFTTFGDTLNPRVGLLYDPFASTTLKLLYGTAFKAPNAYELYYAGFSNKGNPDLKPETINTYELVLEQQLTPQLRFTASGFFYQIDDLISQSNDPLDDLLVYRNVDQVEARGLEAEVEAKLEHGFRIRTSYTYQQTEDHATQQELSNSPNHLGKLAVIVPLYPNKLFAGVELLYTGEALTRTSHQREADWLLNTTLFSQNVFRGLEASLSVYNVLNKTILHPVAYEHRQEVIPQDGRTFWAKLSYRF
jgi:outer membrane receptor for ferrienterochelin and colicins